MGGVKLLGSKSTYATYTCDLRDAVPAQTEIINLYVTDHFSGTGATCSSVNKRLTAGGNTYSNTGTGYVSGISKVSLGQSWTIGGACSHSTHIPWWSARLNGRFRCVMAPYPGNEL